MKSLRVAVEGVGCLGTLVLTAYLAGCQDGSALNARPGGSFSDAYCHFDPVNEFARLGFKVDADVEAGRISPREMYGWKPLQGSLVLPAGTAGCEAVALAIRRALDRALDADCIDELNLERERERGRPFFGMLRYAKDAMRGHVYVWLFPDESETKINYAILIHEGRMSAVMRPTGAPLYSRKMTLKGNADETHS